MDRKRVVVIPTVKKIIFLAFVFLAAPSVAAELDLNTLSDSFVGLRIENKKSKIFFNIRKYDSVVVILRKVKGQRTGDKKVLPHKEIKEIEALLKEAESSQV